MRVKGPTTPGEIYESVLALIGAVLVIAAGLIYISKLFIKGVALL